MPHFVSLYEAKTRLSALVDQAAAGDEIVIAKNGVPTARLMPLPFQGQHRKPAHALKVEHFAPAFDQPVPEIEGMFAGRHVNLLLDTHVFLWWDQQHPSLNAGAGAAIGHPRNNVFVRAASVWEIAIKRRLGKVAFRGSVPSAIDANGFHELPMAPADAELAGDLNWQHPDPFDRMLAAQAIRLGWTLVTADRAIRTFGEVPQIWAG